MSGILRSIKEAVLGPADPPTNRTRVEITDIATRTAASDNVTEPIEIVNIRSRDGRVEWIVSTMTIDAGWTCTIDDASGEVTSAKHHSGWASQGE